MDINYPGGPYYLMRHESRLTSPRDNGLYSNSHIGQGLVAFAFIIPIYFVLLFGMVEFGRAWMTKNILTGAAREAVRIYAVIPYDYSVAASRAIGILSSAELDPTRWTSNIYPDPVDNNIMRTDVSYNFPVFIVGLIPGLPNNNILLATSTSMRRE